MIKILITGGNGNIAKMIKNNLSDYYDITNLSRTELNILDIKAIESYLQNNNFDILVHTPINGGRRTKTENGDVTHFNILMFENMVLFADKFKMIINLDSAAIYDRNTDILNRSENDIYTIPHDYYGFSKYVIYKRTLQYDNIYNFRIFNIFHENEEPDRFIKRCMIANCDNTTVTIHEDKYFDFVYVDDFIKICTYYFDNCNNKEVLEKTINICYTEKYTLSDIAKLILSNKDKIEIIKSTSKNNYSGKDDLLHNLNLNLDGLEKSLTKYEKAFLSS